MVTALGTHWHPEHFCCVSCGEPFGEEGESSLLKATDPLFSLPRVSFYSVWPALSSWVPTPSRPLLDRDPILPFLQPTPAATLGSRSPAPNFCPCPQVSTSGRAAPTAGGTSCSCSPRDARAAKAPYWITTSRHSARSGTQTASSAGCVAVGSGLGAQSGAIHWLVGLTFSESSSSLRLRGCRVKVDVSYPGGLSAQGFGSFCRFLLLVGVPRALLRGQLF